jgi:7-carboxy-7-deazaguanine synthase
MQGTNEVASITDLSTWDARYRVTEIFCTLQGEGPFSGYPAIFIRLATCNLRCTFCDTFFDVNMLMTAEEILAEVKRIKTTQNLIVLTGGEPFIQPIGELIIFLQSKLDYIMVQIETAGTVYTHVPYSNLRVVVSPKTPVINNLIYNLSHYWKYLISANNEHDPGTGIPITATQPNGNKARLAIPPPWIRPLDVFLQPLEGDGEDMAANYAKIYELCGKHGYRASIRLHSIMGLR